MRLERSRRAHRGAWLKLPEREMNIGELGLASHVRACVCGDWAVFLDLKGDRYWALPVAASRARLMAVLAKKGLLGPRADTALPKAAGSLIAWERHVPRAPLVLLSALWAADIVKRGLLQRAFALIEVRKRVITTASVNRVEADHEAYRKLRPWLPWAYICLFDSLSLAHFLVVRGHQVDLVVGVRARPFLAHSWVEAGGRVLESGGEACETYTEIARV